MKQTDPQMKIRLPSGLKEKIAESALANGRSQNAEIVARLEASFDPDKTLLPEISDETAERLMVRFIDKLAETSRRMKGIQQAFLPLETDGDAKK